MGRINSSVAIAFLSLLIIAILFPNVVADDLLSPERRIDWEPGIPGGIPHRTTICANVKEPPYNAEGNGIADDWEAIQQAIDDCPPNQVVYIPEGRYKISKQITLTKSNITLRGAGPDKTLLLFDNVWRGFLVGSGNIDTSHHYIDVVSGSAKNSTSITLSDASSISTGDYLVIDQENDPDYAESNGHEGSCGWCGFGRCSHDHNMYCHSWDRGKTGVCDNQGVCEGGKRTIGHIIKVKGKNGNTITFEPPLYWDFKKEFDPQVIKLTGIDEYIGIEDLYVTTKDKIGGYTFEMGYCAYCWLKNIESSSANQRHIWGYSLFRNEIRDSFFHHVTCYIGNYGYGMSLQGHVTAELIENNIFEDLGTPVSFSSAGGGNVIAYNYFGTGIKEYPSCGKYNYITPSGTSLHGAHPVYNLYEGNVMPSFSSDFIWGSSSHNTVFRNKIKGYQPDSIKQMRAIALGKYSRYFNVIGNILGTNETNFTYEIEGVDDTYCWYYPTIYFLCYKDGDTCLTEQCDPLVKQTLLRQGNYDVVHNRFLWNDSLGREIPPSLYRGQKPSWWNSELQWPPFGPGTDFQHNKIPAQVRFENMQWPLCGNGKKESRTTRIVIDNSDPQCTPIGSWEFHKDAPYAFKNNYIRDGSSSADSDKSVIFSLNVPRDIYQVYFVWQRVWWMDAQDVPVKIIHDNGVYITTVNQTENLDPEGKYLGTFSLSQDSRIIINASSPGYTTVDAIRLVKNYTEECDDGNTIDGDGCSSDCKIESSSLPVCGNSITEPGEACDGSDLNGYNCSTIAAGFVSGTLRCNSDCKSYDTSQCIRGNIIRAKTCSQEDVQSAIDSAQDGDIVMIPSGVCVWTSLHTTKKGNYETAVFINKSILLKGAGHNKTIIIDDTDSAWNKPALLVSCSSGDSPRVSGFTFSGNGGSEGTIRIDHCSNGFRIDHNKFITSKGRGLTIGDSVGLIDHNLFLNTPNEHIDIMGNGRHSWDLNFSDIFGTSNAVFLEDNYWHYNESFNGNGENAIDSNNGARWVFRHNVVDSWNNSQPIEAHGLCVFDAGTRSYEIYGNTLNLLDPKYRAWNAFRFRGGEGVIFNNTLNGDWGIEVRFENYRSHVQCNSVSPPNCSYINLSDPSTWEIPGVMPCKDQIHNVFIWNNTLTNELDVWVESTAEGYIIRDRDYHLRAPSPEKDGFRYISYPYPHPLSLIDSLICLTQADTNCNGIISLSELLKFIDRWTNNEIEMADLIAVIEKWKNG